MGARYPWVLLVASLFTAASVASVPGRAGAEQVQIDVSAKSTAGETSKIQVECATDCNGQPGSASGKVQCSDGKVSRKSNVTCATAASGSIVFYSGATAGPNCGGGTREASWTPQPSGVTCTIPTGAVIFDTGDVIKYALDAKPADAAALCRQNAECGVGLFCPGNCEGFGTCQQRPDICIDDPGQPSDGAGANPACNTLISGSVVLTGDMNCRAVKAHGLRLGSNTTLDCAGHTIYGPDSGVANGTQTGRYGLYASSRSNVTVLNCEVTGYERGFYFTSVSGALISGSTFYGNTQRGGNLAGSATQDVSIDASVFTDNGDEGLHVSGPFSSGATRPNRITNSIASNNVLEGFYLLKANHVQIDSSAASGNGAAGLYVKASPSVAVSRLRVDGDYVHVYDNSDTGTYSWLTISGGRLKLQKNSSTGGVPNRNTFDHVCVIYANGNPDSALYFEGVAAGQNVFRNSGAFLVAGASAVTAIRGTTGNSVEKLYVSPATLGVSLDGTSSFDELTLQSTVPPLCY